MAMKQDKLWTRDFTLSILAGFFASMVTSVLMTTMALYAMSRFGAGEGLAGFASSIAMIGSIFGRLFAGRQSDRIGRRRLALTASALNIVMCALYFLPVGIRPILVIRLVHGAMSGCVHNTMATAVIDFIPPARRTEGLAIYTLNFTLALAVGPPLCMYLADRWPYTALFGANCCFAVVSLSVLAAIRFVPSAFTEEQIAQLSSRRGIKNIFEKAALPLSFTIIPLSMCYASVSAFIETYANQLDMVWAASAFFTIYGLIIIVSRPLAGRLADRRGENYVMIPTMLINAAGIIALGMAGILSGGAAAALFISSSFMMALGFGTLLPIGQAVAVKRAEPQYFGRITASYWVFSDAGMGIGAFIFGLVASVSGLSGMFFIETAAAAAAIVVYWLLHGRYNRIGRP